MGFLHKLWDETLAGPTPETGLAKLRKYNSLSAASAASVAGAAAAECRASKDDQVKVSRSITILRNNQNQNQNPLTVKDLSVTVAADSGQASASSSACTTPRTPLTPGTPVFRRWRSMKLSSAVDMSEGTGQRSMKQNERMNLTEKEENHLMIVMSALDR